KLQQEVKSLEKSLDKMGQGDGAKRKQIAKDIEAAEVEISKLRASVKTDLRLIINGDVAGRSIKDVEAALRQVNRELKAVDGDRGSPEFLKKSQQAAVLQHT